MEKEKTHRKSKKPAAHDSHDHPDHSTQIKRLNRVTGQIQGIERMIVDKRYCPDIITQLKAASAALKAIESEIFKSHLRSCVKSVLNGNDAFKAEEKIQEIIKLTHG